MDILQSSNNKVDQAAVLARKAWTAYFMPTLICLVVLLVVVPFIWKRHEIIALAIGVVAIGVYAYTAIFLHSYTLWFDDAGVWVYSGVLPWRKGSYGVKWRDLDEAVYLTGFLSWLCGSYTIRVGHRFTRASEIALTHMYRGDKAVQAINQTHFAMLAEANDARDA